MGETRRATGSRPTRTTLTRGVVFPSMGQLLRGRRRGGGELGGDEGGDGQNNILSEKQIGDLVQKQLRALHEIDEKLNDENQDDDELEEEAFLDEVRRSSPQSRKPKVDDPARALLDLESRQIKH